MITAENLQQRLELHSVDPRLHGGLERYLHDRITPGSFLRAVLENDLMETYQYADVISIEGLHDLIRFIYNELPMRSYDNAPWGSKDQVQRWIDDPEPPRW